MIGFGIGVIDEKFMGHVRKPSTLFIYLAEHSSQVGGSQLPAIWRTMVSKDVDI
jgi:hypothetical protein